MINFLADYQEDNVAVGMIDFKNIPTINGEVEIGYGLGESYKHLGYMTETVHAFCAWGKSKTLYNILL